MELFHKIREELLEMSSDAVRQRSQHYFKDEILIVGVKAPAVNALAKKYRKEIRQLSKSEFFALCELFWQSGSVEESQLVSFWLLDACKQLNADDIAVLKHWIENYVDNWASCDSLCPKTIGYLLEKYPPLIEEMKRWAKHSNSWLRRAAAVSFIYPAKHGLYLNDIFQIAEIMMLSSEDLVQKGYGWMLKVASQSFPEEVYTFLMLHKAVMPRTAFRYALEKYPPAQRKEAMLK